MRLTVAVTKNFGRFGLEAGFSLEGDRIGLFGPSGSGKSTLISIIAGLLTPDTGRVELDGEVLCDRGAGINVPPEGRRIAVVFQQPHLFPHLSVKGNLLYGYRRCSGAHRRIELGQVAEVLGLTGLLERGVNNLSGGEKQRVAIGRAILANPRFILLDEPLSALDEGLKYQIIPYLRSVFEEFRIPFVFISHSLIEMRLMTDQVIALEKGRVTGQTTADELARQRIGTSQVGYINLLRLKQPRRVEGLHSYAWGGGELLLLAGGREDESVFELSSKDIILFKRHPEAISARNLLRCTVTATFESGRKTGVELSCGGERLVAEVVRQAASELDIRPGNEVYAAIKASAFRELY